MRFKTDLCYGIAWDALTFGAELDLSGMCSPLFACFGLAHVFASVVVYFLG